MKLFGAKRNFESDAVQYCGQGNPSEITNAAFIIAEYKGKMPESKAMRIGKWLFFVAEKYVDDTWGNVKKAVENGKLWKIAKVSTAWRSKGGVYVVCVYTYDYNDKKNVMRIRDYLRNTGFKRPASYKTDAQTLAGIYSDKTDGIAMYKA